MCGYPPRDLVERPSFVASNRETVERIAAETRGIAVICGLVTPAHAETGKSVMNSAALLRDGRLAFLQSKMLLPTYDVFDEMRNFAPARSQELFRFLRQAAWRLPSARTPGTTKQFWNKRLYGVDPMEALVQAGGNFVSEYFRIALLAGQARACAATCWPPSPATTGCRWSMVNQVGGNDSLLFDGSSLVLNREGKVIAQGKSFEEDIVYFDSRPLNGELHEQMRRRRGSAFAALVLGTRDYVRKCGFQEGRHRPERGHRFRADGGHCGGRRWAGERDRCRHAGAIFVAGFDRDARSLAATSASASNCCLSPRSARLQADRCGVFSPDSRKT